MPPYVRRRARKACGTVRSDRGPTSRLPALRPPPHLPIRELCSQRSAFPEATPPGSYRLRRHFPRHCDFGNRHRTRIGLGFSARPSTDVAHGLMHPRSGTFVYFLTDIFSPAQGRRPCTAPGQTNTASNLHPARRKHRFTPLFSHLGRSLNCPSPVTGSSKTSKKDRHAPVRGMSVR